MPFQDASLNLSTHLRYYWSTDSFEGMKVCGVSMWYVFEDNMVFPIKTTYNQAIVYGIKN